MFFQQSHEMQRKSTKKKLVLYLPDVGASKVTLVAVTCRVLSLSNWSKKCRIRIYSFFRARTDKLNIRGKGKRRKKTKLLYALTIPLNLLVSNISVSIIKRKNKKKFRLLDLNRWRYYYRLRLRWCIHESREKWLDGLQRHTQQLSRWLSLNFKSWHNTNRPI